MSVILSSTTDSPDQIADALRASGMEPEAPASEAAEVEAGKGDETEKPSESEESGAADKPAETAAGESASASDAEETEREEEDEEEETSEQDQTGSKPKRKRSYQRKIERLATENGRLQGETASLRQQLDELKQQIAKPAATEKETPAAADKPAEAKPADTFDKPKPKLEDFDTHEDWVDAVSDWHAEKKNADLRAEINALKNQLTERDAKEQVETEEFNRGTAWQESITKAKAANAVPEDFDAVTGAATGIELSGPLFAEMQANPETGPLVGYYLAKNPEEAKRIFKATNITPQSKPEEIALALRNAGREFARLEARAAELKPKPTAAAPAGDKKTAAEKTAPPKPKVQERRVSSAPEPIEPVGGGTRASEPDPSKMSASQWRAFRNSPEGKAYRSRHNI